MPGQQRLAFFGLLTLCICVLALYVHRHRQGQTGRIDNLLISVAGGMQKNVFYLGHGTRTVLDNYLFLVGTQKQNALLRQEVERLRTDLSELQEVRVENERLRQQLEFKRETIGKLMPAHVVAHDVSSDYNGLRIDKGMAEGVKVGMGVISPGGLVGRVLRVTPHYADVMTLTDPSSNIDVVIQRSRARGVLSGQSKTLTCKIKYLDRLEDVAVNDTVVSSGFGGIFPKGLLVGFVTEVAPNPTGILQTVNVKSAVEIYRLEEVFLVLPPTESEKAS